MPELKDTLTELTISSDHFLVVYDKKRPDFFKVCLKSMSQDFFIPASCDTFEQKDRYIMQIGFLFETHSNFIRLRFEYLSNLWKKIYYLDIYDSYIEFYYDLFGKHRISNLRFFEGIADEGFEEHFFTKHFNDKKNTVYREYSESSPVSFKTLFNPEPNVYNKQYFDFFEYSQISVNSDFIDYCGGNFLFNPGILCFSISNNQAEEWLTLGLAVNPGEYHFSDLEYIGGTGFGINLNYGGVLEIKNSFRTPKILMLLGETEFQSLEKYIALIRSLKLLPELRSDPCPDWWRGPIICPVGHQYYQTDLFRIRSPKERSADLSGYQMCTQAHFDNFIKIIDGYNLNWKVLIIDVKWFITSGLKVVDIGRWPDMKNFVQNQHNKGKKVIIWWGPWDTDGWEDHECITYSEDACSWNENRPGRFSKFDTLNNGTKIAPDITLSSVRKKVRQQLEQLLGSENGGINLDGLKLDHTAATPGGYGLQFPEGSKKLYGIEMLKYYHEFIYESIKKIKPDALLLGQSPNPYFSNCIDMIRLGDTYCHTKKSVIEQMSFRYKVAKVANPYWLIDMDNWPMPSLEAFCEYATYQVQHGIPSLYYATHIDTTGEEIPHDVFKKIKKLWDQYRGNIDC